MIRHCSRLLTEIYFGKVTNVCRPTECRDFSDYLIVIKTATIINSIPIFGLIYWFTINTKSELERKIFFVSFTFSLWMLLQFLVLEYYYHHVVRVKEWKCKLFFRKSVVLHMLIVRGQRQPRYSTCAVSFPKWLRELNKLLFGFCFLTRFSSHLIYHN